MIAIVDYGMGNIHSVQKALESLGAETKVTSDRADIAACEKIVLPGVGAFGDAMQELKKQGLISVLEKTVKDKKTFLGICLGFQLLFESSQESPRVKGLGICKGRTVIFDKKKAKKIPHMGWNQLKKVKSLPQSGKSKVKSECPLLKDISDDSYVYFCHSYYPEPKDKNIIAATTDYGIDFASVIWQDNVFGVQFHPEKSQAVGMKILKNFVDL
jgi:glutamine amidotransferase